MEKENVGITFFKGRIWLDVRTTVSIKSVDKKVHNETPNVGFGDITYDIYVGKGVELMIRDINRRKINSGNSHADSGVVTVKWANLIVATGGAWLERGSSCTKYCCVEKHHELCWAPCIFQV